MRKFDFVALFLIAVASTVLGWKLFTSPNAPSDIVIRELNSLEAFEEAVERKSDGPDVYLLARQWTWGNELTLQEGREYNLHLATGDIQHSFHLERGATGKMIDVLLQPGREYIIKLTNLTEGHYAIGCTEYCGIEHNKMRGKLIVRK